MTYALVSSNIVLNVIVADSESIEVYRQQGYDIIPIYPGQAWEGCVYLRSEARFITPEDYEYTNIISGDQTNFVDNNSNDIITGEEL